MSGRREHAGTDGTGWTRVRHAKARWALTLAIIAVYIYLGVTRFLRNSGSSGLGDFPVFHDAWTAVRAGEDLYASGVGGYIYPPLFAALFSPLGSLTVQQAGAVFAVFNGLLLLACLWLTARELADRFGVGRANPERDPALVPGMMLVTLAVFSDKIFSEIKLGQTDLIVLLGLLLGLRWMDRRPILAGIALGFCGNIKYQSIVFLPYLLIRGRWKALGSAVASTLAFAFSTALLWGWDRNQDYLRRAFGGLVRMMGGEHAGDAANVHDLLWIRSISFPSVFARVAAWAGWPESAMPVLTGGLALACLALVLVLYRRNGHAVLLGRTPTTDRTLARRRAVVAIEWIGLLVAVLVFSPQTTARHIVLMIPLGTLAGLLLLSPREGVKRGPVLGAAVFLLAALVLPPGGRSMEHAIHAWRWIGGISIATLTLLFVCVAGGLRWARSLPETPSAPG